jgi:hypothetical protein
MFCDNGRCEDLDVVAHDNKGIQKIHNIAHPKKKASGYFIISQVKDFPQIPCNV